MRSFPVFVCFRFSVQININIKECTVFVVIKSVSALVRVHYVLGVVLCIF